MNQCLFSTVNGVILYLGHIKCKKCMCTPEYDHVLHTPDSMQSSLPL